VKRPSARARTGISNRFLERFIFLVFLHCPAVLRAPGFSHKIPID